MVKVETNLAVTGGMGLDFSNPLFRLKPTTLTINQGNTQVEGATPGFFRVVETGEEFKELTVVLLGMPEKQRQYHLGNEDRSQKGQLNKNAENLACFSFDMIAPHSKSSQPQALTCASCRYANWDNSVEPGIPPACDVFFKAALLDTETQLPMKYYVRGTSKKPFEAGMLNLSRTFKLLQAKGKNPNIFDISFKISTDKYKNKAGQVNYILKIDGKSFHMISSEEAAEFGEIYMQFVNAKYGTQQEVEPESEVVASDNSINQGVDGDGAIVI